MTDSGKYDKIESIKAVELEKSASSTDGDVSTPSRVKFDEAYARADTSQIVIEPKREPAIVPTDIPNRPSLLDLARDKTIAAAEGVPPPTPTQVVEKAELTKAKFSNTIEQLRLQLDSGQQPTLSAQDRTSLTTSIQHMDNYLAAAVTQGTGVETKTAIDVSQKPPLHRFLSFLTEGEKRLDNLIGGIQGLDLRHNRLSPEALLGVQVRLGFVQMELEFFTNVLNKSLESTKTIMNVQI